MKGAPPTRHAQISDMQVIIKCVDQRGREMDERWGIGRLPMLVPIEWAERFHAQHKLFNAAVWEFDLLAVRQHGNAMLRALETEVDRGAIGQVVGGAAAAVVHVIGLHPGPHQLTNDLTKVDCALVGCVKGGQDSGANAFIHVLLSG